MKYILIHKQIAWIFQIPLLEVLQFRHVSELLLLRAQSKESQANAPDARILHGGKMFVFIRFSAISR